MAPRSSSTEVHPSVASPSKVHAAAAATSSSASSKAGVAYVPAKELDDYRVPTVGEQYAGLLGGHHAAKPLLARLNWLHVPLLTLTPLIALYGILFVPFNWKTYAFAVLYYFATGLGITAGERAWRASFTRRFNSVKCARVCVLGVCYVAVFRGCFWVGVEWQGSYGTARHAYERALVSEWCALLLLGECCLWRHDARGIYFFSP